MNPIFLFLNLEGIFDPISALDRVSKLKTNEMVRIGKGINSIIESGQTPQSSRSGSLVFSAGQTLSGGPHPCASVSCRLGNMRRLSAFSALYADKVFIPNFFSYFHHMAEEDVRDANKAEILKERFIGDLTILFNWEPLIKESIVQFSVDQLMFCPDCKKEAMRASGITKSIKIPTQKLKKELLEQISFTLESDGDLLIEGKSNYLGAEPFYITGAALGLEKYRKNKRHTFSETEVAALKLVEKTIYQPVMHDLLSQKYLIPQPQPVYITDTLLETDIIQALNAKGEAARSELMIGGLTHQLPVVGEAQVDRQVLKNLVELRKNEEEAFLGYQYAFQKILKEAASMTSERDYKQAISDAVQPKINEVARVVKSYQESSSLNSRDILFGIASFTAGIFAPSPLNQVGMAVAGSVVNDMRKRLKQKKTIPAEAKKHDFFFLWKSQQILKPKDF